MNDESPRRAYRQSARASAAEATAERILDAFLRQMTERWFDEIRLDSIAREAGVTVQTVIRRFGSKEGLLEAMQHRIGEKVEQRREVEEGDVAGVVAGLTADYEENGDIVMRTLAQEDRFAACKAVTDHGRKMHRQWIAKAFRPWLDALPPEARGPAEDALVVAGDLYVWKLVRRDMRRPIAAYQAIMKTMLAAAIGVPCAKMFGDETQGEAG
jgi:AcrR family transcriptional regulator